MPVPPAITVSGSSGALPVGGANRLAARGRPSSAAIVRSTPAGWLAVNPGAVFWPGLRPASASMAVASVEVDVNVNIDEDGGARQREPRAVAGPLGTTAPCLDGARGRKVADGSAFAYKAPT